MKSYKFYESKNIYYYYFIVLNKFGIQITQRQFHIFTGTVKNPDQ